LWPVGLVREITVSMASGPDLTASPGPGAAEALPRLRRRALLLGLPLAGGAGLVVHVVADLSLPLAILALAGAGAGAWILVAGRLPPVPRRMLGRRVRIGAGAGLLGTVAYDLTRYGVVALWSLSFQPFHVFTVFGELFVGPDHAATVLVLVGLAYHLANGTFFGVAYALVVRRPSWWSGALWGIGLELVMATLYPSWLRIQALGEFLEVSAAGHLVYGAVLGALAHRWLRADPNERAAEP
jgi:hypothetical protein